MICLLFIQNYCLFLMRYAFLELRDDLFDVQFPIVFLSFRLCVGDSEKSQLSFQSEEEIG